MSLRGLLSSETEAACRRFFARGLLASFLAGPVAAPVVAQTLTGDGSVPCGTSYTIASGDTLSGVAARAYGDPMLYRILVDGNRDTLGGNPERVAVGRSIEVPCVDATGQPVTPEEAAHAAASLDAAVAAEGPLTPAELDTLFGPVALFPDPVLTPVLVAVTFPLDVVKAARFVEAAEDLTDQERAAKAASQEWDESVRELAAAIPDLVTRMSDNIDWTEQAGEAVVAQTDGVLDAIQRLRTRAQENGYLVDNEAQTVEEVNDNILISAASSGAVYVPTYYSTVVYTTPVAGPPIYHYGYDCGYGYDDNDVGEALLAGAIILGSAIVLDEIFDDDEWHGWDDHQDIDWDRGDITIDRGDIDIDRGDINVGDGERPRIGDGDRVSIGDSDRPQVERRANAGVAERSGNRMSVSNAASRDVAREKIATRRSTGAAPAALMPSPLGAASRSASNGSTLTTGARTTNGSATTLSRPRTSRPSTARTPSRTSAFQQPSRSRPAAASRGRASAGRSGGGGRRMTANLPPPGRQPMRCVLGASRPHPERVEDDYLAAAWRPAMAAADRLVRRSGRLRAAGPEPACT